MRDLKGKVAVITGAGRGTGKGIALGYGRAGMRVVVSSRSKSTVDQVCQEIKSSQGTAIGVTCDVKVKEQIFALIDQAAKAFGTVDVLVCAAQSFGPSKTPTSSETPTKLEEFDDDQWDNVYRSGLLGTRWAMQAAFPYLKNRGGKIITFGSVGAQQGRALAAAYNATKEGVRALTRTAAREWGKYNIHANCIVPLMMSDSVAQWKDANPSEFSAFESSTAVGRIGDPMTDVAGLATFLASSDSDYMTGGTFMLDGGCFTFP